MMSLESISNINIKFVELESFYENLDNPGAAELFTGMLEMRKSGYDRFYSEKFLPFDDSDLIATHYFICRTEGAKLIPLGGYTRVPMEICDAYQVKFPLLNWTDGTGAETHLSAIEKIIHEHRQNNRHLIYGCRAVLHRRAKGLITSGFLKEFTAGSFYACFLKRGPHTVIAAAIRRARTIEWFEKMGFRKLCWEGSSLGSVRHPKSARDSLFIMEMKEPSDWAKQCYEKHRSLFDDCLIITPKQSVC